MKAILEELKKLRPALARLHSAKGVSTSQQSMLFYAWEDLVWALGFLENRDAARTRAYLKIAVVHLEEFIFSVEKSREAKCRR